MTRKLDLKVGQKVVIRHINDRVRYIKERTIDNIDNWTFSGTVEKIGRKYIQVNMGVYSEKFDIEFDYVQKTSMGSPDYKLYLSKQEIIDEIECKNLYYKVSHYFDRYSNKKFTADQLSRILNIINEE